MYLITGNNINSPVRTIKSKVEVYQASTLLYTFGYDDNLISWEINRVGENNKFFGYGILQKLNVKVRDVNKQFEVPAGARVVVYITANNEYLKFKEYEITEVHRSETTNQLSITAYDLLYWASAHTLSEYGLLGSESYSKWVILIAEALGFDDYIFPEEIDKTETWIKSPNIEGTETLREILDDIAEATQSIYYVDKDNRLKFRVLSLPSSYEQCDLVLTSSNYISLSSGENRRLKTLTHTTSLGDNTAASIEQTGTTQYIRDNVFWTACGNLSNVLEGVIAEWGGFTVGQYTMTWQGDYRLEPGDSIAINPNRTTSSEWIITIAANDTLTYNGAFQMKGEWNFTEDEAENANSVSLGDILKQTYAKVDKANKEIDMVVSKTNEVLGKYDEMVGSVEEVKSEMSQVKLTTDSITAKVEEVSQRITAQDEVIEGNQNLTNSKIDEISRAVKGQITANDVRLEIETAIKEQGAIESITTSTGYTFNESGLNISKSDSEINTIISEDGMRINKNDETVLTADNNGVDAKNLHATTYLIIGVNSRFEDYDNNTRTGCFWIGG